MCYAFAIGDMSSSGNRLWMKESDVYIIINTQDPLLIVDDLRHHNRGHATKYDKFLNDLLNDEEVDTAVDDRRHGEQTHLAKAISVRDLQEQVARRCPGIEIPSKQWL